MRDRCVLVPRSHVSVDRSMPSFARVLICIACFMHVQCKPAAQVGQWIQDVLVAASTRVIVTTTASVGLRGHDVLLSERLPLIEAVNYLSEYLNRSIMQKSPDNPTYRVPLKTSGPAEEVDQSRDHASCFRPSSSSAHACVAWADHGRPSSLHLLV
jgi:hypothetical protein